MDGRGGGAIEWRVGLNGGQYRVKGGEEAASRRDGREQREGERKRENAIRESALVFSFVFFFFSPAEPLSRLLSLCAVYRSYVGVIILLLKYNLQWP